MKQYLEMLNDIVTKGKVRTDRTGTGTISLFGYQKRYDLSEGFPLITTKKLHVKSIIHELLWFLAGDTNIKYLLQHDVNIWNDWAILNWSKSKECPYDLADFGHRKEKDPAYKAYFQAVLQEFKQLILHDEEFAAKYGELGNIYGEQWRSWKGADGQTYDQIDYLIKQIKTNPDSRRLIVNAWNVADVMSGNMALPPCHASYQFYVEEGKLSCLLNQRSGDAFLGIGFNIASYALLTHMIAGLVDLEVGEFIHCIGDLHIYSNHLDQVKLQLSREPKEMPKLLLRVPESKKIDDYRYEDFTLIGYDPHPMIKAPVAV